MDVVRAGELHATPQCVQEAAALDERGGNRETEEREPRDRHEVDPREVAEEPREADRQECDVAGRQRDDHVTTTPNGPHQGNRSSVRSGEDERADQDVEDCSRSSLELAVRHAEERGADAKSE